MKIFSFTAFQRTFAGLAVVSVITGCTSEIATAADTAANTQSPARSGTSATVYAAGDIAYCKNMSVADSGAAKTAAVIAAGLAIDKDAVAITLGDNTYPNGRPLEFSGCYDPTWGQFKARTLPSPGNHDYNTEGAAGYYDYFGDAAGPGRRGYYSVDLGKWHLVSLNSNLDGAEHQAQLDWLKVDLAQNKTQCTLAYWHHPLFSSGGHGNNVHMQDVWSMLHTADADLVLVGHDHDYERFAPQDADGARDDKRGIRQFVVGTGGAKLTMVGFRKANSEISYSATHGVLKLDLKDSWYEWEFLTVAGEFTDRGVGLCH